MDQENQPLQNKELEKSPTPNPIRHRSFRLTLKNKHKKQIPKKKHQKSRPLFLSLGASQEKESFIENLAMLLASGMNVLSALDGIKSEMHSSRMKKMIDNLASEIDSGVSLSKALTETGIFPARITSLIRIGEETGRLSESLKVVATQQQKDRSFRSRIRSAMTYPVIVLVIAFLVGIGVIWFLLPRLANIFSGLNVQLPWITKALIALGNFVRINGLIVIPTLILFLILIVLILFVFPKTKVAGQAILFKIPGVKKLLVELELARFGYILGTLLNSGLPVIEALDSLREAANVRAYQKLYIHLRDNVKEGNSFQKSLTSYKNVDKLIPHHIQQMIIAAEQSGRLSASLLKIGKNFEEKSETTTKDLTVILEPILLVIVWVAVLLVALSVILPIYSLIGGLDKSTQQTSAPAPETSTPAKEKPSPETAPISTPKQLKIISPSGYADVYFEATLDSEVVGRLQAGDILEYSEQKNDWYKVTLKDGQIGWVFKSNIELINQ